MKPIFRICIPALSLLAVVASAQQRYTVTDIEPIQDGNFSQAFSVNDSGLIGGQSTITKTDATQRAVIWVKGWKRPILVGSAGVNSATFGINERGQAEIQSELAEQDPNAENFCGYGTDRKCVPFVWHNYILRPLRLLGGNNGAVGGINNRGEISGWTETSDSMDPECAAPQKLDFQAVIWDPRQVEPRPLPLLPGDTVSMAIWINDKGQAVGTSGSCADTGLVPLGHGAHPVLWERDGTPVNIGLLDPTQEFGGIALSINNRGQVVGGANQPDGSFRPFLWSRNAGVQMLDVLPGGVGGGAVAINDEGNAVGQSFDADGNPSPVVWYHGGDPINLNDLARGSSLTLVWPTAINSRGEISGFGMTADGDIHGFVAAPRGSRADHAESAEDGESRPPVLSEKARTLMRNRFGRRHQ